MSKRPRGKNASALKAKVALEAFKRWSLSFPHIIRTILNQITDWKKPLFEHSEEIFSKDREEWSGAKIRGWIAYYGRFYPSEIGWIWKNINGYLIRCVRRKYKRFASHKKQARCYLRQLAQGNQRLFIHWELGCCHMAWVVEAGWELRCSRPVLGGAWGESPTVYSTIYSNGQMILLYCGKHGLGKQDSPFLAKVQHHGQFMLCGWTGRSNEPMYLSWNIKT